MRRTSKLVRTAGAISAIALIGTACGDSGTDPETEGTEPTATEGSETPTEAAAAGGEVSTYIGEPEHLFPQDTNESEGNAVLNALFTGLIEFETVSTEPYNAVAEDISTDDEGKTWTIKLKEGWTFHNGEAVTADSFINAWNYGVANALQTSGFFSGIAGYQEVVDGAAETMSGIEKVSDTEFTVSFPEGDPFFDVKVGYTAFLPLPEVAYEDPEAFEQAPIGNGPFMMDGEWQHNQSIRVVRYDDYAGEDKPKLDAIEFAIYDAVETAYQDLQAGTIDIVDSIPTESIDSAEAEFGDKLGNSPSSSINYLGFPSYVEWLTPEHRAALSMAIDRETLNDTIFNGSRQPAYSIVNPVIPGYQENVCENWNFDAAAAKAKWDEAGGYDGPIVMWFNSGGNHEAWIEAVKNMWVNTLGVSPDQFEFKTLQFAEYLPIADAGEFTGPFRLGWGMDYPHPQNYLEPLFHSEQKAPAGSNSTFYDNPEFDALIAEGNAAGGLEPGIPFYQDAEKLLCEDTAIAPIAFGQNFFASTERVQDLYVDAFSNINYTEISVSE